MYRLCEGSTSGDGTEYRLLNVEAKTPRIDVRTARQGSRCKDGLNRGKDEI